MCMQYGLTHRTAACQIFVFLTHLDVLGPGWFRKLPVLNPAGDILAGITNANGNDPHWCEYPNLVEMMVGTPSNTRIS